MCSKTSPRVSFSHDLGQADNVPIELNESRRDAMFLESFSDFEFNICSSSFELSSSADELFANGMILPVRFQEKKAAQKCQLPALVSLPPCPKLSSAEHSKKESIRQTMPVNSDLEEKPQSKSPLRGFKRSSTLNYDIKKSLICSLPLLWRSNSTGSVQNPKRSSMKNRNKHSSQKLSSISMTKSSSSSSCCSSSKAYQFPQKPPLKKNHGNSYGNSVRISPILNVPPPYISKGTANLFGLSYFLRNGKDKKSRK